jgi:PAS domain S-box-containing protein
VSAVAETVRVLLVEDSEDDARLIRRELEQGGFDLAWKRVESEPDFVAALQEPWDLIVSDFQMPRFNGLRAFAVYRELGVDVPFIFVSGALGEERAVEAMRAGARDYLLKDNLARLTVAVRRELAAAQVREAQRNAEELARRDQQRLELAVGASGAGIFEYRLPLGSDTYYDQRWAATLGFAPEEIPTRGGLAAWLADRLAPEDLGSVRETHARFVAGRTDRLELEVRVLHKDGYWIHVGVSAHALERDAGRRATHVVGVMLDVTERRRLEAQFRQAQKMEAIGRLAGGVAHDVNNLLSVIVTSGQFALGALEADHPAHDDVQQMLGAAARVGALTEQLLAFSRSKPVVPRVLSVNKVVADVDSLLRRLVGREVEVSSRLADDLWNVRIDQGSLEQVVANLAVNARDAMPSGGQLLIETANLALGKGRRLGAEVEVPAGDYVVLRVSDQGVGIDEAIRRQIFEPFFTTKPVGKGTGLGLATCYGIVKQAGGFIGVESQEGHGTTFRIYLPRVTDAPDEAPVSRAPATESLRGTETVLLVEDDDLVRQIVTRVLTGLGYRVFQAASGASALAECKRLGTIDVLLTDMIMPDMSGVEVVERVTGLRPGGFRRWSGHGRWRRAGARAARRISRRRRRRCGSRPARPHG